MCSKLHNVALALQLLSGHKNARVKIFEKFKIFTTGFIFQGRLMLKSPIKQTSLCSNETFLKIMF